MKKSGFTLAEVLITLGIIGVVSAVTLPTLMSNSQYKQVGVKLSKMYSTTENAARAWVAANGNFESVSVLDDKNKIKTEVDENDIQNFVNESYIFKNVYKSATETVDDNIYTIPTTGNCLPTGEQYPKAELKDGTKIAFYYGGAWIDDGSYGADNLYPADKYGTAVFTLIFSPNVKGLPSTAETNYLFAVTTKGFVLPTNSDLCAKELFNNDWNVKKSYYTDKNGVCNRTGNRVSWDN